MTMERAVTAANAEEKAAAHYPGGWVRLRKDCRTFLELEPSRFFTQRRCELATSWLRCGHSIEDVSARLGFATPARFQAVYSGTTGRVCATAQARPGLATPGPEELAELLRPFWWPADRPRKLVIPSPESELPAWFGEEIRADFMTWPMPVREDHGTEVPLPSSAAAPPACLAGFEMTSSITSEEVDAAAIAPTPTRLDDFNERRSKATAELMERAQAFLAMKSTGAEIIVPFFDHAESGEALAA